MRRYVSAIVEIAGNEFESSNAFWAPAAFGGQTKASLSWSRLNIPGTRDQDERSRAFHFCDTLVATRLVSYEVRGLLGSAIAMEDRLQ